MTLFVFCCPMQRLTSTVSDSSVRDELCSIAYFIFLGTQHKQLLFTLSNLEHEQTH